MRENFPHNARFSHSAANADLALQWLAPRTRLAWPLLCTGQQAAISPAMGQPATKYG
jgi:hypothetical protein